MRLKPQRDDFTVVAAQRGGKPPSTLKTHTSDPAKACPDAATIQPKLTVHAALTKANTVTGDLFEHTGTAPITSHRAWPLTRQ